LASRSEGVVKGAFCFATSFERVDIRLFLSDLKYAKARVRSGNARCISMLA
jgi:hypothetical protein